MFRNQNDYDYLYLNGYHAVGFENIDKSSFKIIINQTHKKVFKIKWPKNILWPNKETKQITSIDNSIDFF